MAFGIDFGTTNSSLAFIENGHLSLAQFSYREETVSSFRSVLYVYTDEEDQPCLVAGPKALELYLENHGEGRLIKSVKNFLADRLFSSTLLHSRRYDLEDLIVEIVRPLIEEGRQQFAKLSGPVVVGRPVRFVGQETPEDEAVALQRLSRAMRRAGIEDFRFEYEPIAAAFTYEQRLSSDEIILVVDVGGGTTDFCVAQVGPGCHNILSSQRILATGGIGIAGDAFDGLLVHHVVTPLLGRGKTYSNQRGDPLPIPHWIYERFARLAKFPSLRTQGNMKILHDLRLAPDAPSQLETLEYIVKENLGFQLFEKMGHTKMALSTMDSHEFLFTDEGVYLSAYVEREHFEEWMKTLLSEISRTMKEMLGAAEIPTSRVAKVFLTGGSSLVPALKEVFTKEFGLPAIAGGEEFTSVATGLALAAERG